MSTHIGLLASRLRLEEKKLLDAFAHRGVTVDQVDPRALRFGLTDTTLPWQVVLNREISGTRARYAALSLEAAGVLTLNSARASEICGDKWQTSVALREAGVEVLHERFFDTLTLRVPGRGAAVVAAARVQLAHSPESDDAPRRRHRWATRLMGQPYRRLERRCRRQPVVAGQVHGPRAGVFVWCTQNPSSTAQRP